MGCIVCECLGPKRRQEQVFIKLIQEIHDQSTKVNLSDSSFQNPYQLLLERLIKKGLLRKLSDNLSSRRNKILQALIWNHKLTFQTRDVVHLCSGLIVTSQISQVIYPKKINSSLLKNRESQQSDIQLVRKQSISKSSSQLNLKKSVRSNSNINNQIVERDPNIDEQILKTIREILQKRETLENRCLEALNDFCERHPSVLESKDLLWVLIKKCVQNIRQNKQVELNCKILKNLLSKTKEQASQVIQNRHILQLILRLWMKQEAEENNLVIKSYCEQILNIYFSRYIGSWESDFLFESIFITLDKLQFNYEDVLLFEKLINSLIANVKLNSYFTRSLFHYLIGYLLIDLQDFQQKRYLISSLAIKLQNIKLESENAHQTLVKIQCLKIMNFWLNCKYIDINELCLYNSEIFIHLFLHILRQTQKHQVVSSVAENQIKSIFTFVVLESRIVLFERLLQQFYKNELYQQQSLIKFMVLILNRGFEIQKDRKNYTVPLQQRWNMSKKLMAMKINLEIIKMIGKFQIDEEIRKNFISLFKSFISNMVIQGWEFLEKYRITEIIVQYISILVQKNKDKLLMIALYYTLSDKLSNDLKSYDIDSQFCLLTLGFDLKGLISEAEIKDGLRLKEAREKIKLAKTQKQVLPILNNYFFQRDELKKDIPIERDKQMEVAELCGFFQLASNDSRIGSEQKSLLMKKDSIFVDQKDGHTSEDNSFQQAINIVANV